MSDNLVNQPSAAPTRKLVFGTSAGVSIAVAIVPVAFPILMQVLEKIDPAFAAEWGQIIAAAVSALMSVLGGSAVAYVSKNRAAVAPATQVVEAAHKVAVAAQKVDDANDTVDAVLDAIRARKP